MTALISTAIAELARTQLERFLVHSCTVTPVTAGSANDWNEATDSSGSAVTGVACKYVPEDRVRIEESGQVLVSVPTVAFAHDQTIAPGALVSNIRDSDNVVLLIGPATVEYLVPSAGLGPNLKLRAVLRVGDVR